MKLFSWNLEERELDSEISAEESLIMEATTKTAQKKVPDQRLLNETLMHSMLGFPDPAAYVQILARHGELFLHRLSDGEDRRVFLASCRGHFYYGMQRRFITTAGHLAGWQNLGDQAWNSLPEDKKEVFEEEHLKSLLDTRAHGRERVRNWEKGVIAQITIPACSSLCKVFDKNQPKAGEVQKNALEVLGDGEEGYERSLQNLSNHAKRRLSIAGSRIDILPDTSRMPWGWAGIEGDPIPSEFPGMEDACQRMSLQLAGLILLKGVAQRAYIRQTIRQESYALQTPLIDTMLIRAEEEALVNPWCTELESKLAFATQNAWDILCRLDGKGILKGDKLTPIAY